MPVVKTLYVQVGGLCMIVPERNPERLSLLMPTFNHPNHLHCPYLHVSREYGRRLRSVTPGADSTQGTGAGKDPNAGVGILASLSGRMLDLSGIGSGGDVQPLPDFVLDVSATAGPAPVPVDPRWLTTNTASGPLASRVRLPLSAKDIENLGGRADLEVHYRDGRCWPISTCGRVGIEIAVDGAPPTLPIQELDIELVPDENDAVELAILNVRPKDLSGRRPGHRKGQHAHHLAAYYHLLEPRARWSTGMEEPPMIHVARDVDGPADTPGDSPCATGRYFPLPRWSGGPDQGPVVYGESLLFIDPFNCTVGGGCPSGDC